MQNSEVIKPKTIAELRESLGELGTNFDAEYVLRHADKETKGLKEMKKFAPDTNYYKAMTLFEFDKGILMASSLPERFGVFALEFSRNLQVEYDCEGQSGKSLAEVVSLNFVRTLWIQDRIRAYLAQGSITDMGVKYLDVLSRELDRAERHYLTSLQALRALHSPSFNVNIKTNTAVIGQNQAVQVKNA